MDWKALIGTVAPWIGAALGGPLGSAAIGAAAEALGLSDKTEETLKNVLAGVTPEQMLALKNADQAFALKMQELGYKQTSDLEAIAAGDRKDARDMQKATRSPVPAMLSVGVTLGYFAILIGMMTGWLKVSDSQALLLMLGSLSTGWGVVMAFWFGTTADSGRKTELLAQSPAVTK
jgi:hypothetical protein